MSNCKACGGWFSSSHQKDLCPTCQMALKRLNGYVEPVWHGRWDGDTCTNCKLPWNDLMLQNADDWGYFDPMPPFCPNCGAKMDVSGK